MLPGLADGARVGLVAVVARPQEQLVHLAAMTHVQARYEVAYVLTLLLVSLCLVVVVVVVVVGGATTERVAN